MSQHIYKHGDVEVRMGYDRPLDFVFCTVAVRGEIEYSNLGDPNAGTECQDVEYYRPILETLSIQVPDAMFMEIKEDQINRVGNRVRIYE